MTSDIEETDSFMQVLRLAVADTAAEAPGDLDNIRLNCEVSRRRLAQALRSHRAGSW